MLIVVSGSRDWTDAQRVFASLALYIQDRTDVIVVHGGCRGLDLLAASAARSMGCSVREVLADWATYGRRAGPVRNRAMLDMVQELVLYFHDDLDASKGTKDLVTEARRRGLKVVRG